MSFEMIKTDQVDRVAIVTLNRGNITPVANNDEPASASTATAGSTVSNSETRPSPAVEGDEFDGYSGVSNRAEFSMPANGSYASGREGYTGGLEGGDKESPDEAGRRDNWGPGQSRATQLGGEFDEGGQSSLSGSRAAGRASSGVENDFHRPPYDTE